MATNTWALKRQLFYVFVLIVFFASLGFLLIYPSLNKPPSCIDGKQNGDELGIDCGGSSCALACSTQVQDISVLWARSFKVVTGRYNAVAYLLNHNKTEAVKKLNYRFRFADANNVYIGKREGSTFVPPGSNFAVFEAGIDIGNSIPVYVTFEFTEKPIWIQVSPEKINQLKLLVSGIQLTGENTAPRLTATIKNTSLFTIPDVDVIAILYDKLGNAISTSRTYLNQMKPLEKSDLNFTWPLPLPDTVVSKEIMPMYDIFSAKLQ